MDKAIVNLIQLALDDSELTVPNYQNKVFSYCEFKEDSFGDNSWYVEEFQRKRSLEQKRILTWSFYVWEENNLIVLETAEHIKVLKLIN